jgi:metal-responsive CopG/Arc/MetJ family transcriptional regulator
LEVIVAKGLAKHLKELSDRLKAEKGVKFTSLSSAGSSHGL